MLYKNINWKLSLRFSLISSIYYNEQVSQGNYFRSTKVTQQHAASCFFVSPSSTHLTIQYEKNSKLGVLRSCYAITYFLCKYLRLSFCTGDDRDIICFIMPLPSSAQHIKILAFDNVKKYELWLQKLYAIQSQQPTILKKANM